MLNQALFAVALLLLVTTTEAQRVRLVGGSSPHEGRLEVLHYIYYDYRHIWVWGTVCDDGFTDSAASVVCYQVGFRRAGRFIGNRYGAGSGPIYLDDVQCNGTETNFLQCRHNGWGRHNCVHSEDVSISCTTVRLIGGTSLLEGRLEVYYNDTWGTVCNESVNGATARVICYMLGYGHVGRFVYKRYGEGKGRIWMDNILCNGTETDIANCLQSGSGVQNCTHRIDVSVSCINVRLVGSSRPTKGRLEVHYDGTWGTVCDNGFTDAAARVVCNSLGFGYVGRVTGNAFGAGSGRIWLDNVRCNGTEFSVASCQHNGWGNRSCRHSDDVSLSCIADSAEAVALVGRGNPRVVRLEVFHAHQWGTVCDDGFTDAAARVVCYSLGFGYVGRKVNISLFGIGDGLIWFNNVNCTGTEKHIGECSRDDWGVHNCQHRNDVAVSCTDNTSATLPTGVRLVGNSSSIGRLEVLHNGLWGTVCGDYFTATEERVVCKMLGFASGMKVGNTNYLTSHGPIWLDKLRCNGTERDIAECSHNGWGVHNCGHSDDVAVSCTGVNVDQVRLNGGRDPREGRLEMFYNGTWRAVCHYYTSEFKNAAARVACNMLGYGFVGTAITNTFGDVDDHVVIWCRGNELSISDCSTDSSNPVYYCWPKRVAAVSCLRNNAVTLVGGGSPREGRIELYRSGTWGTVCDDRFNDAAARVVCYSLGFGYVGRKMNINIYGIGRGRILLDDVQCKGSETHIYECSHRRWGHNCVHNEDVAVSCVDNSSETSSVSSSRITRQMTSPSTSTVASTASAQRTQQHTTQTSSTALPCQKDGRVALVGGRSPREGRLEVCHNGIWGTVCDDLFNEAAAKVVCYSLGYGYVGREIEDIDMFPIGEGVIWLDDLHCNGSEIHISECSHSGWGVHNCVHKEDVAVSCIRDSSTTVVALSPRITSQMTPSPKITVGSRTIQSSHHTTSNTVAPCPREGNIELIGERSSREGRLQVCHNGIWGTVCDDGFTDAAARVVCYSLGYGYVGREVDIDNFGVKEGQIWLDDIQCNGTERHISECSHSGWGVHNCVHKEDVAVSCIRETSTTVDMSTSLIRFNQKSSAELTLQSTTTTRSSSDQVRRTSFARSTIHSTTSTQGSSYQFRSTSFANTNSTSKTTSHPTPLSTTSIRSSINRAAPDTTQITISVFSDMTPIVVAVAVVCGLLLILIVVVIVAVICVLLFRRKPRQERTEIALTPVTTSASTNNYNNDSFGEAAKYENPPVDDQAANYNTYSEIQPSPFPSPFVGGSVGDVGSGDKPFAKYDLLPGDQ